MIQRIVCFKFKSNVDPAAIAQHMAQFAALQAVVPEIRAYHAGAVVTAETDPAPEYDTLHYLTFEAVADIDRYFWHTAHQAFIKANEAIWERVLVLNFPLD